MTFTTLELLLSPVGYFSVSFHPFPSSVIASSRMPQRAFPMLIRRLMARLVSG
jgi:hypothetical protein